MSENQANDSQKVQKIGQAPMTAQDADLTRPTPDDLSGGTDSPTRVRIAVRSLAETVHRHGGLAGPLYGGVSAVDGMRLHQRFITILTERHGQSAVQSEVYLQAGFDYDDLQMTVSGRCDALVQTLPSGPVTGSHGGQDSRQTLAEASSAMDICLIEAKSFTGSPDRLPREGETVHWAQARLYGWLYLSVHPELEQLTIGLVYIGLESNELLEMDTICSRTELQDFFADTCRRYAGFTADMLRSQRLRDQSGRDCRFPYPLLRSGQKRFMQEVVGAVRQKSSLFIQAPTGIGKTMAALYPAVKALANHLVDHVFYLTHVTSTRLVAARALADLHQTGLLMRSITLYAKEKMCLMPELYCDTRLCPFAVGYYDHLPAALRELFLIEQIGQAEILSCSRKHQVCPFELSLDVSLYCEVIICDYNHAFDPRVKLVRFFGQDLQTHLLLVDEAHNLPARSRSMYSATLNSAELAACRTTISGLSPLLDTALGRIHTYLEAVGTALNSDAAAFDQVERHVKPESVMQAERFRAMRQLPTDLLSLSSRFIFFTHQFLDEHADFPGRQSLLKGMFMLLFFNRVADEFFGPDYVTVARQTADQAVEIELMCLDASEKLAACYQGKHPAIFFSATLSPINYFMGLLQGKSPDRGTESLLLGSPFPPENLLVLVCSKLSTRYKQRTATIQSILQLILAAVSVKTGNYLVFVPSFAYLQMLRGLLRSLPESRTMDCIFQIPNMDEKLRQRFLSRFERFGEKTLLAVAVIGGIFSEGIDLTGEKLAGVVIVGVGLPQISPEREIMKQYYGQALGSGYEYAYLFPGFNRVQQAAGRVIRSEQDRGFVLLIDDRYETDSYISLFPGEWQPKPMDNEQDVTAALLDFWGDPACPAPSDSTSSI